MVLFQVPDGMTFSSQKPFKFDHANMLGRMSDEYTSVQDLLPNSNMSTIKLTKGEFTIKAGASAWFAFMAGKMFSYKAHRPEQFPHVSFHEFLHSSCCILKYTEISRNANFTKTSY